jgi:DNA-directed RNA polymerase beta subunit
MASLNLKEELAKKEQEYHFSDAIFGMTLLTNPGYISSSRDIMFTAHLRQFVNLTKSEFPKVFTNYENTVGENSTGYYRSKSDVEIVAIVPRFGDGERDKHLYCMFTYDKKTDTYDVITKKYNENLTEKFGYGYNNDNLDSKEVGDKINKDECLYRTHSYDEDMDYGYGRNATVMYTIDTRILEDAIICSESFAKSMISKEIDTVKVPLNDNDILCNLYGTNTDYKGFPEIGDNTRGRVVCARRRIHNNQMLYDLKTSNLKKINTASDQMFYSKGKLVDITIYSNKSIDELPDTMFNAQIKRYLKMQTEFYQNMFDMCEKIINSGSKYSADIGYYYKKAKDILDPTCAWREESGSVFSNLVIEFTIERDVALDLGSKITGRYGNKGVIAQILPDDKMPFLANGKRVDVILSALGVVNRLNSAQLFEHSINFICNCVVDKLKTLKTHKAREKLLFDIVGIFNKKEAVALKEYYNELNSVEVDDFYEDIYEKGIYIHTPPLWETEPIFNKLRTIYAKYDWIKPVDVYVNVFGRDIKIMQPMIIGELYIIKLKQNSKKNFSVRSTGALSRKGLPDKSYKNKTHQDLHSSTPIRMGVQETYNASIGVSSDELAKFHMLYRSSAKGRQKLSKKLMQGSVKDIKLDSTIRNRNSEILGARLKALGLRIDFLDDYEEIKVYTDHIKDYKLDNGIFIGTEDEYEDKVLYDDIVHQYETDYCFVGTTDEYQAKLDREFKKARDRRDAAIYIDVNLDED